MLRSDANESERRRGTKARDKKNEENPRKIPKTKSKRKKPQLATEGE